mgnify:CR=1 FL=1
MDDARIYRWLADAVLLVHAAVFLFLIGGWLAICLGHGRGWSWTRYRTFRWAHLATLGVVTLQAWLGWLCPLTSLESWLRHRAGQAGYDGTFIQYWVHRVLFLEAPLWVFALAYTGFTLLVLWAWWKFPPNPPLHRRPPGR